MTDLAPTPTEKDASLVDYIKAWPQYALPHNALTTLMYKLMRSRVHWWKTYFIRWFMHHYRIDLSEAVKTNPSDYEHFNAFFTRALRPEARGIDSTENGLVCPVDGSISQFGDIKNGEIFQAKGQHYRLDTLLTHHPEWVNSMQSGQFMTIYLAPNNYHRIHIPCDAVLTGMRYVPGRLFSVNPATARTVPGLFARNERLICAFDTPHGKLLLIMVGALFVSGIETTWHGEVSPPHGAKLMHRDYPSNASAPSFTRGDEIGRFNMGSTVIMLFEPNTIEWAKSLTPGKPVRMGSFLAIKP